jgi:hypothetical protein
VAAGLLGAAGVAGFATANESDTGWRSSPRLFHQADDLLGHLNDALLLGADH